MFIVVVADVAVVVAVIGVVADVAVAACTCVGTNRCDANIDSQLAASSQHARKSRVDAPGGKISLKVVSQILPQRQQQQQQQQHRTMRMQQPPSAEKMQTRAVANTINFLYLAAIWP